jgi:deoxyribodipyrimidine photo-lyase
MRDVPDTWLFEPWLMPDSLRKKTAMGNQIVDPLVDLATATRESKQRLYARRNRSYVKEGKKAVVDKHASRKPMQPRKKSVAQQQLDQKQLGFNF